jgi:hypothetical protein
LDSLVRNEIYQWVTRTKRANYLRARVCVSSVDEFGTAASD